MEAQLKNATDSLHRLEPLLSKEFVTPDKIDQARTAKLTAAAGLDEARRKMDQAEKDVGDLEALLAKRDAALAALGKAELDLGFCYVRAQFDALVVNLHTADRRVRRARPGAGVLARRYARVVRPGGLSRDRARPHRPRDGGGGLSADRSRATASAAPCRESDGR